MAMLTIRDLPASTELGRARMGAVRGGFSLLSGLGPVANIQIAIDQDISQLQQIEVNALNNVGFIGAGFGGLKLDLDPKQFAVADVSL